MRTSTFLSAVIAAAGFTSAANAASVAIDTFDAAFDGDTQMQITLASGSRAFGPTALGNGVVRSGTFDIVTARPRRSADINIDGGTFYVNNDAGVDSRVRLRYDVGALLDNAYAGTSSTIGTISLGVLFADIQRTLTLFVNSETVASDTLMNDFYYDDPGNPQHTRLRFDTSLLANGGDDYIILQIEGASAFDYEIDSIAAEVPAPGALGLMGLGLIGLAAAAKRRSAR